MSSRAFRLLRPQKRVLGRFRSPRKRISSEGGTPDEARIHALLESLRILCGPCRTRCGAKDSPVLLIGFPSFVRRPECSMRILFLSESTRRALYDRFPSTSLLQEFEYRWDFRWFLDGSYLAGWCWDVRWRVDTLAHNVLCPQILPVNSWVHRRNSLNLSLWASLS